MGLKVLVTGASSGIGRAAAQRFSKDGHDVYITARSEDKLNETLSLAKEAGIGEVFKGAGDVGVEADVLRNEEAIKALGHIDLLVLNAGVGWALPLEEFSVADFDQIFKHQRSGSFHLAESSPSCSQGGFELSRYMGASYSTFTLVNSTHLGIGCPQKQGFGQIIIVNSISGLAVHSPGWGLYAASKFALRGMADALRMDVKGTGIKVASVHPGTVDTNIWSHTIEKTGRDARKILNVDAALKPEDIADNIATIAYQDPRSDIDLLRVFPSFAPKRHGVSLN